MRTNLSISDRYEHVPEWLTLFERDLPRPTPPYAP